MSTFVIKFTRSGRLHIPRQPYLVIKRYKKYFASLHSQEKRLFIFPNTAEDKLSLPAGIRVCKNVDDFKIKTLKGGFQRRPELLVNKHVSLPYDLDQMNNESPFLDRYSDRFNKNKRIQKELVKMAVSLYCNIEIKSGNDHIELETSRKDEKNTLVLDIGCGDGSSTEPLLDMGFSCVGVDVDICALSEFQKSFLRRRSFQSENKLYDFDSVRTQKCQYYGVGNSSIICSENSSGINDDINEKSTCSCSKNSIKGNNVSGFADVIRWDLRRGLPFRKSTFDMVVSISFLQWLFYGDREKQLELFFSSLKSLLLPQGKAVIQFYPKSASQLKDAIQACMKHFQGVLVGDYPHIDRGRKLFLVVFS